MFFGAILILQVVLPEELGTRLERVLVPRSHSLLLIPPKKYGYAENKIAPKKKVAQIKKKSRRREKVTPEKKLRRTKCCAEGKVMQ